MRRYFAVILAALCLCTLTSCDRAQISKPEGTFFGVVHRGYDPLSDLEPGEALAQNGISGELACALSTVIVQSAWGETFKDYTDLELYTVVGEDSYWIWCRPNFLEAGSTFDAQTPKIRMSKSTGRVEQLYTSW